MKLSGAHGGGCSTIVDRDVAAAIGVSKPQPYTYIQGTERSCLARGGLLWCGRGEAAGDRIAIAEPSRSSAAMDRVRMYGRQTASAPEALTRTDGETSSMRILYVQAQRETAVQGEYCFSVAVERLPTCIGDSGASLKRGAEGTSGTYPGTRDREARPLKPSIPCIRQ
jgi:hypothetical protein